jgi:hypothetical protein
MCVCHHTHTSHAHTYAKAEEELEDHRRILAVSLAGKEAMATMRMQLAESDPRLASLSGECWMGEGRGRCGVKGVWESDRVLSGAALEGERRNDGCT